MTACIVGPQGSTVIRRFFLPFSKDQASNLGHFYRSLLATELSLVKHYLFSLFFYIFLSIVVVKMFQVSVIIEITSY